MAARSSVWCMNLVKVKSIPIRIHFTFFIFLLWIALEEVRIEGQPVYEVLFVLTIFLCVLLHELGHAITAQQFRIKTRDITLYPFGGIASLMGEAKPLGELLIALAGPMVNVLIAVLLWSFTSLPLRQEINPTTFIDHVFIANVVLVLFNSIPAFPMDGGRVLRASLMLLNVKHATAIATRISQVLSILLGIFALYHGNFVLIFIAALVFSNAVQEHMNSKTKELVAGKTASDVMIPLTNLEILPHATTISQALQVVLRSLQPVFPIMHDTELKGIVSKDAIIEAAAVYNEQNYISSIMAREVTAIAPDTELSEVIDKLRPAPEPILVMDQGKFLGIILKDKLIESLLVYSAEKQSKNEQNNPDDMEIF